MLNRAVGSKNSPQTRPCLALNLHVPHWCTEGSGFFKTRALVETSLLVKTAGLAGRGRLTGIGLERLKLGSPKFFLRRVRSELKVLFQRRRRLGRSLFP